MSWCKGLGWLCFADPDASCQQPTSDKLIKKKSNKSSILLICRRKFFSRKSVFLNILRAMYSVNFSVSLLSQRKLRMSMFVDYLSFSVKLAYLSLLYSEFIVSWADVSCGDLVSFLSHWNMANIFVFVISNLCPICA